MAFLNPGKCIATLLLATAALPAAAHVVLAETHAAPGTYYAGFFRVSHGCGNSPTLRIRIEIPSSIDMAHPQPKPGWELTIERGANPERVTAVVWEGRLEADHFDQFGVMFRLPRDAETIYFPVVQTCVVGENRWTEIPRPGQARSTLRNPAAVLHVDGTEVNPSAPPPTHQH